MGGEGSGRKPDPTNFILNFGKVGKQQFEPRTPVATEMFIPNHSGIMGSEQAKGKLDARYLPTYTFSQPSRAIDTIYQNTSSQAIMVVASFVFPGSLGADTYSVDAQLGATSPPTSTAGQIGHVQFSDGGVSDFILSISFIVPSNYYYRLVRTSGTGITLNTWSEITI